MGKHPTVSQKTKPPLKLKKKPRRDVPQIKNLPRNEKGLKANRRGCLEAGAALSVKQTEKNSKPKRITAQIGMSALG